MFSSESYVLFRFDSTRTKDNKSVLTLLSSSNKRRAKGEAESLLQQIISLMNLELKFPR